MIKVFDIFKMRIAHFIYSCLNKTCPVNFHSWFKLTMQIQSDNTRSQYIEIGKSISTNNLFIPSARTSHYGLKLIKVQGPKIWNELPPLTKNINSPKRFIRKFRNEMIESYKVQ